MVHSLLDRAGESSRRHLREGLKAHQIWNKPRKTNLKSSIAESHGVMEALVEEPAISFSPIFPRRIPI